MDEKIDLRLSTTKDVATSKRNNSLIRLRKRIQMNEWTFSFLLFIISLSIVLGKLYINYGTTLQLQNVMHIAPTTSMFPNVSNVFSLPHISNESKFNVNSMIAIRERFFGINEYNDVINIITLFFKAYGWLIRAAVCGFIMMVFSCLIIYKDSSIPGINPPIPFSPSKNKYPKASAIPINYMIGILNGILIFAYMCL